LQYKARPLNGIWAVGPFLHNGSVPTLYDLLSPASERPAAFLLGNPEFDPVKVGIVTHSVVAKNESYDRDGFFILNTALKGNRNTGHVFSNQEGPGVIGRSLSVEERYQLIEFLKTM